MDLTRLWTIRIAGTILLSVLLYQSWQKARADFLADSGRPGDLDRAIAMDPDRTSYRLKKASTDLYSNNTPADRVKTQLLEVLKRSPHNAEALMDLGLLHEAHGVAGEAERNLLEAAAWDHTYKPLWTLANFYFRTNQPMKMWPAVRNALTLTTKPQLDFFDPTPLYELSWQAGGDPKQILALIPDSATALSGYFVYLVRQRHIDAAAEVYPRAIGFADFKDPLHREMFAGYCNLLFLAGRTSEAVDVWNQLVMKHLVESTVLRPERGESMANSSFALPVEPSPFGWFKTSNDNVESTFAPGLLLLNFNGKQAETVLIVEKNLPVLPGRDYLLTWDADGNGIVRPTDLKESGLSIRFYDSGSQIPAACSAFLSPEQGRECRVHVPGQIASGKTRIIHMTFLCQRQAGSVRLNGAVRLTGFHLTLAHDTAS